MTHRYRIPTKVFFVFALGCTKPAAEPVIPAEPPKAYSATYWGTASGLMNGRSLQNLRIWAASRTPCNAHAFDIFITEFNNKGEELVTFTLANIPKRPIKLDQFKADDQNLFCESDTVGSTLTARSKTGFTGTYKPFGKGNQLIIASYDSTKKEITGSFRLKLIVDKRQSANMPDTLKIEQGTFRTRLRNANGKYE